MSCSESCGPKPTCMKYMAMVQTRGVPKISKHLTKEEKEFWDPEIDQHALAQCTRCQQHAVDYRVPRYFWSPHFDATQRGIIMCKCNNCGTDHMIKRRL